MDYITECDKAKNPIIPCVPLTTKLGISLIILPLMRILQRNLKRTYLLQTHTFSFLTQRAYSCSNFVVIS